MATEEMKHDTPEAARKRQEQREETTEEQLKRLEMKVVYMRAELDGMDALEKKRKESRKTMIAFMLGFCYALLLVAIISDK